MKKNFLTNSDHNTTSGAMTERRGYIFDQEDAVLATIGEYDGHYCVDEDDVEEISEDHVTAAKCKTKEVAAAAEKEISDLISFLGKVSTGTATRNEMESLKSLHGKLSKIKKEVEMSKDTESEMEIKMLKCITRRKTVDLK